VEDNLNDIREIGAALWIHKRS